MSVQNSLTITGSYDAIEVIAELICNFRNLRISTDNLSNQEGILTANFDSETIPVDEMKVLLRDFANQGLNIELRYLDPDSEFIGVLKVNDSNFDNQNFSYSGVKELETIIDRFDGHDLGENQVLDLKNKS